MRKCVIKNKFNAFRAWNKMLIAIGILLNSFFVSAQDMTVTGVVVDEKNEPLTGVNVVVKGKTVGTVTDLSGQFSIKANSSDVLVISFVGYKSEEIAASTSQPIRVVLKEDVQQLNEVVVVGYGVQKKSDLTGAVASIKAENIKNMPVTRVDEALQGKAAGVIVLQNSGQPGAAPVIRVRGLATVNGGNPLVVVDGIPGGSMNDINPNDIESMEVLKDAASQAIYGSAGGNGVILITTKRGKSGHFNVNFDAFWGSQSPWSTDNVKVANAQQYAKIYSMQANNETYFPFINGKYTNPDSTPLADTKWTDEIFRKAFVENYNVSVSAGSKKANVYSGLGYSNEEGTVWKTYNKKYTFRINSDYQIIKMVQIGESFNFTYNKFANQDERNEYSSPLSTSIQMLPIVPVRVNDSASSNFAYKGAGLSANIKNPMAQIEDNNNRTTAHSIFGNAFIRISPIKGLTFESNYGINQNSNLYKQYNPLQDIGEWGDLSATQSVKINTYSRNTYEFNAWQWQNFFTYDATFAEKHNFTLVAGMEAGYSKRTVARRTAHGIDIGNTPWEDYTDTTNMQLLSPVKTTEIKGNAYFARLNYNLASILLLQLNIRHDKSSKFGPNNRAGTFPAISAGLKFSEFDFIKNLNIIDFGKIRAGYGETGNSDIEPFLYNGSYATLPITSYPFGGTVQTGAGLITAANPDLGWETVVTSNFGIDLGFLKNKISLSADYFLRRNKNMLLRKSVPYTVGYIVTDAYHELGDATLDTRPLVNYGTLDNKGFEITLGYKDQFGPLKIDLNGNITHATTKIDKIGDPLYAGSGRGLAQVSVTKNGQPVAEFYGYKVEGIYRDADFTWYKPATGGAWKQLAVDPNGYTTVTGTDLDGNAVSLRTRSTSIKPGYFKYVDVNNDGRITPDDMQPIGDPNPKFTYGFNANFEFKSFDLSMFFQGSYGNKIFNLLKVNLYSSNNGGLNWSPDLIDSYVPARYNTRGSLKAPELISEAKNVNSNLQSMDADISSPSDFYVEDGSYLRLKSIQIGYTLPVKFTQKYKIAKLRLYVGAKNLLTFTKYTGFDPEVGENSAFLNPILERGFDRGTYPQSKMFLGGINLSF